MDLSKIPRDKNGLIDLKSIPLPSSEDRLKIAETVLGLEILAPVGAGRQGSCHIIEDMKVFKLTGCTEEALLATYISENPNDLFPQIHSVFEMEDGFGKYYGIIRDEVADVFDEMNDEDGSLERICRIVWPYLDGRYHLYGDPVYELANRKCPDEVEKLAAVYADLELFTRATGIEVTDLVFSNLGRTSDNRIVIRDFGENTILDTVHAAKATAGIEYVQTNGLQAGM